MSGWMDGRIIDSIQLTRSWPEIGLFVAPHGVKITPSRDIYYRVKQLEIEPFEVDPYLLTGVQTLTIVLEKKDEKWH